MIFLRIFTIFLLIYAYRNYVTQADEESLSKYICRVTENILTADNDTKDVTIAYLQTKFSSEFINSIAKCVSRHSLVLTVDFSVKINNARLRKSAILIIITDVEKEVRFPRRIFKIITISFPELFGVNHKKSRNVTNFERTIKGYFG